MLGAVVCPHPPLLLRELGGAEDPVADLRSACETALRAALRAGPDSVLLVGGHDTTASWDPALPPPVHRYAGPPGAAGAAGRPAEVLPTSLAVGLRLLDAAGWSGPVRLRSVAWDAGPDDLAAVAGTPAEGDEVVLALADGSARRGEKAPGYLDPRSFAHDQSVSAALRGADATALEAADPSVAAGLMDLGRAALAVLGSRAGREAVAWRARVLYEDDPFGVLYRVVVWSR